jgi:hypothetical protein
MPSTLRRPIHRPDLPDWPVYLDDAELVAKIADRVRFLASTSDTVLMTLLADLERRFPVRVRT